MKIVADENMPAVGELFAPFADVVCLPGRAIHREHLLDADGLLVRSVTAVGEQLLAGSTVKFVGSATIGTDHVDLAYLAAEGIPFAHAPGCNADAVVDYVLATLCSLEGEAWLEKTLAIVGCGNVGGRLYRRLTALGVSCLCYDPFLNAEEQPDLQEFSALAEADILCLHTPLTKTGCHPTFHLFDADALAGLKPGALLINAGRGAVVDNAALLAAIERGHLRAALDVWEGEPGISPELLAVVCQGTPHIAGYSLEGRLRGTLMVYQAFCQRFGFVPQVNGLNELLELTGTPSPQPVVWQAGANPLARLVLGAYDPGQDCARLRAIAGSPIAQGFDNLRKQYPLRREFSFNPIADNPQLPARAVLAALGFL